MDGALWVCSLLVGGASTGGRRRGMSIGDKGEWDTLYLNITCFVHYIIPYLHCTSYCFSTQGALSRHQAARHNLQLFRDYYDHGSSPTPSNSATALPIAVASSNNIDIIQFTSCIIIIIIICSNHHHNNVSTTHHPIILRQITHHRPPKRHPHTTHTLHAPSSHTRTNRRRRPRRRSNNQRFRSLRR